MGLRSLMSPIESLWESASGNLLLTVILVILVVPTFLIILFIALSPGIVFERIGMWLKSRFPELSKSKSLKSTFSLIGMVVFVAWLYFIGSLLDRL